VCLSKGFYTSHPGLECKNIELSRVSQRLAALPYFDLGKEIDTRGEAGSAHHRTRYMAFGVWTWQPAILRHTVSGREVIDAICP
jgi:hypothetical protein